MSVVSQDEVKQVAFLARMGLGKEQLAKLAGQIDRILHYIQQLQSVSTEAVEPTSHVVPLSNVMRPDEIRPSTGVDDTVSLAPARHHRFVKVPKIIE
ncbi:MAG: Asp-tRNA(Asn)/Glu-tRNA(Gln) amidotransferase subunit GatC [Candidatus Omnitrophica bacterium]|nr:Asp-tRNA(Asn)/Glu-tRNA(Gln) amidotransferase subunit GatC [Candidatus Omnitrophota bacterium]